MAYSFNVTVAARGYHVYKSTIWVEAKAGDKVRVEIETDEESRRLMHIAALLKHQSINKSTQTTGNISKCSLFVKAENGSIEGSVKSIQYKPSPVPAEATLRILK